MVALSEPCAPISGHYLPTLEISLGHTPSPQIWSTWDKICSIFLSTWSPKQRRVSIKWPSSIKSIQMYQMSINYTEKLWYYYGLTPCRAVFFLTVMSGRCQEFPIPNFLTESIKFYSLNAKLQQKLPHDSERSLWNEIFHFPTPTAFVPQQNSLPDWPL